MVEIGIPFDSVLLGQYLKSRMIDAGYVIRTPEPIPRVPFEELVVRTNSPDGIHSCDTVEILSAVLVFDIEIPAGRFGKYIAERPFDPYWVSDVYVSHRGMSINWARYRQCVSVEAIAAIVSRPSLGTVQFYSMHCWDHRGHTGVGGPVACAGYRNSGHHLLVTAWSNNSPEHKMVKI